MPYWTIVVVFCVGMIIGEVLRIKSEGFKWSELLGAVGVCLMSIHLYLWLAKTAPLAQTILKWSWMAMGAAIIPALLHEHRPGLKDVKQGAAGTGRATKPKGGAKRTGRRR